LLHFNLSNRNFDWLIIDGLEATFFNADFDWFNLTRGMAYIISSQEKLAAEKIRTPTHQDDKSSTIFLVE